MSYQPQWDGRSGYGGKRKHMLLKGLLVLLGTGMICFGALEIFIALHDGTNIVGEKQVMVIFGCQVKEDGPPILLRDRLDSTPEVKVSRRPRGAPRAYTGSPTRAEAGSARSR